MRSVFRGIAIIQSNYSFPHFCYWFACRNFVALLTDTESWANFLRLIFFILQWSHFIYLQLEGVHITTMQVVFNMAAERLLCPDDKLCSLYVLLFYTVIAYVQRSLQVRFNKTPIFFFFKHFDTRALPSGVDSLSVFHFCPIFLPLFFCCCCFFPLFFDNVSFIFCPFPFIFQPFSPLSWKSVF